MGKRKDTKRLNGGKHRSLRLMPIIVILIAALLVGASATFAKAPSQGENGRAVPMFGGGPPPSAPRLHSVTGCTQSPAPTLSWEPVEGATSYRIEIYETDPYDPKGTRQIADLEVESSAYTSSTHFWNGFQYRWRVRGLNPAGPGAFSEYQQFVFCNADQAWEIDTFDELELGQLKGQNGWATRVMSPRIVPFEDMGNILRVDRLDQRSMIAIKNIDSFVSGEHSFEFDVMITGANKASLATLSLETKRFLGWNKKFRFEIGKSINLITGASGKPLPMVEEILFGHWYTIRCEMDLDREALTVSLDGEIYFKDMPMHPGPINGLRITGKRGFGEVRFDNLVGFELSQTWGVEIVEPKEDETVQGSIDVSVNTGSRTEWVKFYLDNVLLTLDGDPPYEYRLATTQNPLPQPNHPMDFGYYFVEWKNPADFDAARKEVADYTNLYYASRASYDSGLSTGEWLALFEVSIANAANEGRSIQLALDREDTWDAMLEIADPYWGYVERIEVGDEPDLTLAETEAILQRLNGLLSSKGMAPRPLGFVYRYTLPLPNAVNAPSLDWVGLEAYVDLPGSPETMENIAHLQSYLQWLKEQVPNGKDIVLVMMAYDRNGQWQDIDSLRDLQLAAYWLAYDDPRVVSINMFAYSRAGGTRDHPSLITPHKLIADRIFKRDIPFVGDGRRTLSVRAVDDLGNETWDHVHVFVENGLWTPDPSLTPTSEFSPTPVTPVSTTEVPTPTATEPPPPSPAPTIGIPTPSDPETWEYDDFGLPLGPLAGQDGWEALKDSAEIVSLDSPETVMAIDPLPNRTIQMLKDVPDQNKGTVTLGFNVLIRDASEPSLAKLVIETYLNSGWNHKYQIYFGSSIRVNTTPTGEAVTLVEEVMDGKMYLIEIGMNLDTGLMSIWVDGRESGSGLQMHSGPITHLSVAGWDRKGAVYLDNMVGVYWPR